MFFEEGVVEIVTGVNLPMVIKFASHSGNATLSELAKEVVDQGRRRSTDRRFVRTRQS